MEKENENYFRAFYIILCCIRSNKIDNGVVKVLMKVKLVHDCRYRKTKYLESAYTLRIPLKLEICDIISIFDDIILI